MGFLVGGGQGPIRHIWCSGSFLNWWRYEHLMLSPEKTRVRKFPTRRRLQPLLPITVFETVVKHLCMSRVFGGLLYPCS